jgi:hypothetical protein
MGLRQELAGQAAVPQSDGVSSGVRVDRSQTSSRDSHGLLCWDRRVVGPEQRVRGGWCRSDRARGQSGERPGGPGASLQGTRRAGHADRAGGRTSVTVVACRAERGRVRHGPAGDAPCDSGALGDGGEDRPQRRSGHRSAPAHGLVPAGAPQVTGRSGDPGFAGRSQAAAGQAARCGT